MGKNKQGAKKIIHHTLVFKATDNLRESNMRKRIDMHYNKCEHQIWEKHQAKQSYRLTTEHYLKKKKKKQLVQCQLLKWSKVSMLCTYSEGQ